MTSIEQEDKCINDNAKSHSYGHHDLAELDRGQILT